MATVTITFHTEDDVAKFDVNQYGTVTSRGGPSPIAAFPSGRGGGASAGEPRGPRGGAPERPDPRMRQTIVVLNTGSITLAEVQRALKAARVNATAA